MADAHAKPRHDYHLVDPSPWPAVGSISAFVMAVGAISWMHHLFAAAPLVFAAGDTAQRSVLVRAVNDLAAEGKWFSPIDVIATGGEYAGALVATTFARVIDDDAPEVPVVIPDGGIRVIEAAGGSVSAFARRSGARCRSARSTTGMTRRPASARSTWSHTVVRAWRARSSRR